MEHLITRRRLPVEGVTRTVVVNHVPHERIFESPLFSVIKTQTPKWVSVRVQCGFQCGFQCRINSSKMLFDKKIRVSAGSFDFLCLGKWCSRPHDGGAAARKCKKKHTALCYSPCFQMCDTLRRITMMLMMLTTNSSNTPKAMAGSMVVSAICGKKVVMTPV